MKIGIYVICDSPMGMIYFWDGKRLDRCSDYGIWNKSAFDSVRQIESVIGCKLKYLGC